MIERRIESEVVLQSGRVDRKAFRVCSRSSYRSVDGVQGIIGVGRQVGGASGKAQDWGGVGVGSLEWVWERYK